MTYNGWCAMKPNQTNSSDPSISFVFEQSIISCIIVIFLQLSSQKTKWPETPRHINSGVAYRLSVHWICVRSELECDYQNQLLRAIHNYSCWSVANALWFCFWKGTFQPTVIHVLRFKCCYSFMNEFTSLNGQLIETPIYWRCFQKISVNANDMFETFSMLFSGQQLPHHKIVYWNGWMAMFVGYFMPIQD